MSVVPMATLEGYRFLYKGVIYNVLGVMLETMIQFEDEWGPTVRYTTDGTDKAFVRSLTEFQRKFFALDAPIKYDGLYRPALDFDGSHFQIAKYEDIEGGHTGDSSAGIRRSVAENKGRPLRFETYEDAKRIADKLNAGFKK